VSDHSDTLETKSFSVLETTQLAKKKVHLMKIHNSHLKQLSTW